MMRSLERPHGAAGRAVIYAMEEVKQFLGAGLAFEEEVAFLQSIVTFAQRGAAWKMTMMER